MYVFWGWEEGATDQQRPEGDCCLIKITTILREKRAISANVHPYPFTLFTRQSPFALGLIICLSCTSLFLLACVHVCMMGEEGNNIMGFERIK